MIFDILGLIITYHIVALFIPNINIINYTIGYFLGVLIVKALNAKKND